MLLIVLMDLNTSQWKIEEQDPFDSLQIFMNSFKVSSAGNIVKVINNQSVIYNSSTDADYSVIKDYLSVNKGKPITPKDLGFALMSRPNRILIYSNSPEEQSHYLEFLKCMFAAQKLGVRIDSVCPRENLSLKMCSTGTKGTYTKSSDISSMIGLLGVTKPSVESYTVNCICCNKRILQGLVCPICLSVYCKFTPICKICKTKFDFSQ